MSALASMEPAPAPRHNARRRAIGVLAALLTTAGLAIVLLSAPAERHLDLTGELDRFTLPNTVEIEIPQASGMHLRNMDLRLRRIDREPRERTFTGTKSRPPGTIVLRPVGRRGRFTATIPRGSVLQFPSAGSVHYDPPEGGALSIAMEADTVEVVEANRVEPRFGDGGGPFRLSNPDEMVQLDAACREDCSFELSGPEFSSVPEGGAIPVDPGRTVVLPDFRVKEAILRRVKDADLSYARASAITLVAARGFEWTVVARKPPSTVAVSGRGFVSSLRQDDREVLPSRAADLLSADPATRGIYGGLTLLVVLAWAVLFRRALDILVQAVLPE
jgi:hypothetical protein